MDFAFTMVNKEHFSKNESISEKGVEFTVDKPTHGRKTFIGLSDLLNRQFRHKNDSYLLELELRSISTHFEQVRGVFIFRYGMNLNVEIIVQRFRKIIKINEANNKNTFKNTSKTHYPRYVFEKSSMHFVKLVFLC